MARNRAEVRYEALKRQIVALGWARPGSVVRRYMPCGNPSCRCMADPPHLHGPYYQWSHKIRGRTQSLRLSTEQARLCRQWADTYRRLRKLLRSLDAVALEETDRILGSIS